MSLRIVLFGNGDRGAHCLAALVQANYQVVLAVAHGDNSRSASLFLDAARNAHIPTAAPRSPNGADCCETLRSYRPDLFVLAAYGNIIKSELINIPTRMCINLHGGKLPECRGSSPMNWALIRGAPSFTLSIIKVDGGIDTGPVLLERSFPIALTDTIRDLHKIAHAEFPKMLLEVVQGIERATIVEKIQNNSASGYYPLRFPDDGFILWDQLTARSVYDTIRALTDPYPCAFSFYQGRRVQFLAAELLEQPFYGEPGRIYRKDSTGIIVCAKDCCLRLTAAKFADTGESVFQSVKVYECFSTLREAALKLLSSPKAL